MKKAISSLLICLIILSLCSPVFAASTSAKDAADALFELGLFNGVGTNSDGTPNYDLNRVPTRQEAVTMLIRLLGKENDAKQGTWTMPFTDVADWAIPYVGYAYANKLVYGTGDTTFGGSSPTTATQYLTFVLRALGYDSNSDFKWDSAWELSDKIALTHGEYGKDSKFLRADVASISYNALSSKLKGTEDMLIKLLVSDGAVKASVATSHGFDLYGWTDHVHFIYDIRTFTLYAFMNYTGYDDNNGRPITGVRKAVRDDLAAMDLRLSEPQYYSKKSVRNIYYDSALRSLGGAPNFAYLNGSPSELRDLPEKLREFYLAADIPALYEKYRGEYETVLNSYRGSLPAIVKMVSYLHADTESYKEFGVEVNLLDAFERGHGLGSTDAYCGFGVIRTGPSNEINTLNILHEYAHGFVGDELDRLKNEVNALSKYYDASSNAVSKQGYNGWPVIVDESFVRAFSTYFDTNTFKRESIITRDTADGFVLTRYIYDRIPEFEHFDGTLGDFMKMLLVEYPQYA